MAKLPGLLPQRNHSKANRKDPMGPPSKEREFCSSNSGIVVRTSAKRPWRSGATFDALLPSFLLQPPAWISCHEARWHTCCFMLLALRVDAFRLSTSAGSHFAFFHAFFIKRGQIVFGEIGNKRSRKTHVFQFSLVQ